MSSWIEPVAGDVIHYRYLWRHEYETGHEDGVKVRPCLVVGTRQSPKGLVVHTAPITTQRFDPKNSEPIPPRVIEHLKLDSRSIIVTTEYNSFVWIGPDVFPRADGLVFYGKAPERLHDRVRSAMISKRAKNIVRTV